MKLGPVPVAWMLEKGAHPLWVKRIFLEHDFTTNVVTLIFRDGKEGGRFFSFELDMGPVSVALKSGGQSDVFIDAHVRQIRSAFHPQPLKCDLGPFQRFVRKWFS